MKHRLLFTVGHSTHPVEHFINLLDWHHIDVVADVRSTPYSRYNPQYNRDELKGNLRESGISYVFMGKEFGARSDDPSCYREGRVQYAALATSEPFQSGVGRINEGVAKGHRIALMCAEKDPLECHRTILVAQTLDREGFEIAHILEDGQLETHAVLTDRLISLHKLGNGDLFMSRDEVVDSAFSRQEARIAYAAEYPSSENAVEG